MFGKKTEAAMRVMEGSYAAQSAKQHGLARDGARAYAERLRAAIETLSRFDDKRVQSRDDLQGMKDALTKSGTACCMVTLENGFSALLDVDSKLIATYMPDAINEQENKK